jgi:hypothetical protein
MGIDQADHVLGQGMAIGLVGCQGLELSLHGRRHWSIVSQVQGPIEVGKDAWWIGHKILIAQGNQLPRRNKVPIGLEGSM